MLWANLTDLPNKVIHTFIVDMLLLVKIPFGVKFWQTHFHEYGGLYLPPAECQTVLPQLNSYRVFCLKTITMLQWRYNGTMADSSNKAANYNIPTLPL